MIGVRGHLACSRSFPTMPEGNNGSVTVRGKRLFYLQPPIRGGEDDCLACDRWRISVLFWRRSRLRSTSLRCRGPLLPDRRVHPRFSKPNQGFKGLTTGGVQRLPRGRIGNWVHIGARFGSESEQTAQPRKAKQHTRDLSTYVQDPYLLSCRSRASPSVCRAPATRLYGVVVTQLAARCRIA